MRAFLLWVAALALSLPASADSRHSPGAELFILDIPEGWYSEPTDSSPSSTALALLSAHGRLSLSREGGGDWGSLKADAARRWGGFEMSKLKTGEPVLLKRTGRSAKGYAYEGAFLCGGRIHRIRAVLREWRDIYPIAKNLHCGQPPRDWKEALPLKPPPRPPDPTPDETLYASTVPDLVWKVIGGNLLGTARHDFVMAHRC